jgi:HSP90 family molecular chaperone
MRFEAHPRLLELLVGSNLYPDTSVVLRELIQNAQDAIQWRSELDSAIAPSIAVRFQ